MTPPVTGSIPRPVLLVVDTGVDDALAIVAAHRHPDLDLVGVVASAGNVSLARAAANTRAVLEVLGCRAPLLRGAATRNDGRPFAHRDVHGPDGLAGAGPPQPMSDLEVAALPGLTQQRLRAMRGRVGSQRLSVVCLAPLTSVVGLPAGPVAASYARPGEANHDMDPDAAALLRAAGTVRDLPAEAALPALPAEAALPALPDLAAVPGGSATSGGLRGLVRTLLWHQRRRGAGLGDAAAVLRLAGSADPGQDLVRLLRQ